MSTENRKGMGNWEAWGDDVEPVFRAAEKWAEALKGIARPWLYWNVDADRRLPDGTSAAVSTAGWRDLFSLSHRRFWELIGCTKRSASRDRYEKGCGWSLNFQSHRNCAVNAGDQHLPNYYWDHGSGIYNWKRRHGGKVLALKGKGKGTAQEKAKDFSVGHFSQIKFEGYKRVLPNNEFCDLSRDLSGNFQLCDCARKVGVAHLLRAGGAVK